MNLSNVITLLEDEKYEMIEELKKLKKEKMGELPIDRAIRRMFKDYSVEDNIDDCKRDIDEFTEAIRILRLSSSEED